MKVHKQPRGTTNCTLRRTGTLAERGEAVLIYNFDTTASVGRTTHVDAHKGMWKSWSRRDLNSQYATWAAEDGTVHPQPSGLTHPLLEDIDE